MVQNFKKNLNRKLKTKSHSRGIKCQPKANNNREAVVVCAKHVVKRPSKRMRALVYTLNRLSGDLSCWVREKRGM